MTCARLRLQRGWSLVDLSKVIGMYAVYLDVPERGEHVPNLTTSLRVAQAFGVASPPILSRVDGEGST